MYWLYRARVGSWIAAEADDNCTAPVGSGIHVFKTTCEHIDDVATSTYALAWLRWDTESGVWSMRAMRFPTIRMPPV